MKTIGNIIWFLFGGLISAIGLFIVGIFWCMTIIGIPFGKICFRVAHLVIAPFGKTINSNFGSHPIANFIWLILFGWEFAIFYCVFGLVYCITVIGIPMGLQSIKLAKLLLFPFGAEISSGSASE